MSIGWVASSTRGRLLTLRLVGAEGARALSRSESWPDARAALGATIYGAELDPLADRAAAHRAVASTTCWYLRVMAGWLPANAAGMARMFAGPVEITNIEHRLAELAGNEMPPAVDLGSLAIAWPQVAAAPSAEGVRDVLNRSTWGDPGGDDLISIGVGLRIAWLRRLARTVGEFGTVARGAAAVALARETFAFDRPLPAPTAANVDRLLGRSWRKATTLSQLEQRLPPSATWALEGLTSPSDLWSAEMRVVNRCESDAQRMAAQVGARRSAVAAVMMRFLVDRRRVDGAIEIAGRSPAEVFDVVA